MYMYISALHRKKNTWVLPDSKQIYEKNLINVQMYDYATHTYTICNLKQLNNHPHIIDSHYCLHLQTCKHLNACNLHVNTHTWSMNTPNRSNCF